MQGERNRRREIEEREREREEVVTIGDPASTKFVPSTILTTPVFPCFFLYPLCSSETCNSIAVAGTSMASVTATPAPLTSASEPAPSDNHHLLQRLIQEGLTASGRETNLDSQKYRRLLEVLCQACLLEPAKNAVITPEVLERASYTLAILSRQTTSAPNSLSPDLYKWVLPRLLHACREYSHVQGAAALAEDLSVAAASIVVLLGKDLSGEQSVAKGLVKGTLVLRHLHDFALCELTLSISADDRCT